MVKIGLLDILHKLDVQIVQPINVDEVRWCDEAVLFYVENGKGTLTHRTELAENYTYFSQLLLNGKPIIQGRYSDCPTCMGMLATGYGIENIQSQELEKVRECMNLEYKSIQESFEDIKPLLGLLDDGYYVLADVKLYPSDGQGGFFYSVPNELSYNEATYRLYYNDLLDAFPAYFYPTQSSELINEDRVEEYIGKLKSDSNQFRGLAYYEVGFMCALLDGHHKACAASALGTTLSCLTIIPTCINGVENVDGNSLIKKIRFADTVIDVEFEKKLNKQNQISANIEKDLKISLYNLTDRKLPNQYINRYPTVETIAKIYNNDIDIGANAIDYAKSLVETQNENSAYKLACYMKYLFECGKEEAYSVAKIILDEEDECYLKAAQEFAIKEMLEHQNEEAEQYLINYLANHNSDDQWWDLVSSYWE